MKHCNKTFCMFNKLTHVTFRNDIVDAYQHEEYNFVFENSFSSFTRIQLRHE